MKRFLLILVLLNIVVFNTNAQIRINIDSLELSQISVTLHNPRPGSFMNLGFGSLLNMGPTVIFHISITNKTDTFVPINYHEWIFGYFYSYQGKTDNFDFLISDYTGWKAPFIRILLVSKEDFQFSIGKLALLGYHARKNKTDDDYNFSKEMLEILPTIRVYAISPDRKIFFSDTPKHIVIKKNEPIKDSNYEYKDVLNVKKFLKKLSKTSVKYSRH